MVTWDVSGELFSFILCVIVILYLNRDSIFEIPYRKFFVAIIYVNIAVTAISLISSLLSYYPNVSSKSLLTAAMTVAYIVSPLSQILLVFYTMLLSSENHSLIRKFMLASCIPYVVYVIIIFTLLQSRIIFYFTDENIYVRGPWAYSIYMIFYLYVLIFIAVVSFSKLRLRIRLRNSLLTFIVASLIVAVTQMMFLNLLISNAFSSVILLLFLLYFQNNQIIYDSMTKTLTRSELIRAIDERITQRKDHRFSIVTVSLCGFKQVNQRFGQQNCNVLLSNIASYIKSISKRHSTFRYSGDEFSIIVDSDGSGGFSSSADQTAERILERFRSSWEIGEHKGYVIPVAVGIVVYPDASVKTVEEILNGIDICVSSAKRNVNSSVCFCTAEMIETNKRRTQIINILQDIVKNKDFELYYQPILSLRDRKYYSAEALIRVNNSPIGPVSPSDLITIAEESGIIIELTHLILDKACKFVRRLLDSSVTFEGIAINLSSVQCMEENLAEKILYTIEKNHVPPSKIQIEITETTFGENPVNIRCLMNELSNFGVLFSIDDFGTGYSNLQSLVESPFNILKIDRSLISNAAINLKSGELVRHITWAMQETGIKILAEGVESPEENFFAIEAGVDYIQGYLYNRPMPENSAYDFFVGQTSRESHAVDYSNPAQK